VYLSALTHFERTGEWISAPFRILPAWDGVYLDEGKEPYSVSEYVENLRADILQKIKNGKRPLL